MFKLYTLCAVASILLFSTGSTSPLNYQSDEVTGDERGFDSLGGGHILRGLDSLGGGHILRNPLDTGNYLRGIYRNEKPRQFFRNNRAAALKNVASMDTFLGNSLGTAKRFDSLSGLTFGQQKRNLDEIDRTLFEFAKRNFDEIDRSEFDRFVKKRETSSQLNGE